MEDEDRAAEAENEERAHEWATAIRAREAAALERLVADEYVPQAPGIGRMPRAAWLHAALHAYEISSFAFDDVLIHVYGDTAVMQSRHQQQASFEGEDRSGALFVTDVWVRLAGRWQVAARHSSFAPPD